MSYKAKYVLSVYYLQLARVKNHQKNVPLIDWFWLHIVSYVHTIRHCCIFKDAAYNNNNIMKIITILCLLHINIITGTMYIKN